MARFVAAAVRQGEGNEETVVRICRVDGLCFSCQAFPQPFPNKPVRMLIGPGAGGPTDGMARTYASKMSELWGQQLVVENRPGAGNTLAPTIAAKSTPDGYTIVYCGISDAIAPARRNRPSTKLYFTRTRPCAR